ncbi:MAG: alpha/beta hydrolase [Hyphomicrobiaceae bacterium]
MGDDIDAIRRLLVSKPRPTTLAERRERLDEIGSAYGVAPDIVFNAARIGGVETEWSAAPGSDGARVLIFFHGGGYCSGSIRSHRSMASEAGRAAGIRALAVGYRLAPEHPYPAALQDAMAVYDALLADGVPARHVAVGGDSAGGNLTLALMLSLRDAGKPLPACGWMVSPWTDLAMAGATLASKASVDPIISKPYLQELADAYLAGTDPKLPLVSPLNADLTGLPPLLVQVGSAETLLDDAIRIAARAAADDVRVTLEVWPHMIHAWHLWGARLASGRAALTSAGAFMRAALAP